MYFTDAELERCRMANEIHDLKRELEINSDVLADVEDDAKKYRELTDGTLVDADWLTEQFGNPFDGGHYREWNIGDILCGRPITIVHEPDLDRPYALYLQSYMICRNPTRGQVRAFLLGCQVKWEK